MQYFQHYSSPLGGITLASDGEAITGLWFDGQKHFGENLCGESSDCELEGVGRNGRAEDVFSAARKWLDIYFSGREPDFTPPVKLTGTPFRQAVWEALLSIPYGQTVTYGQLAARLGLPKGAARAVGGAVGRNPVSLIVPCHRVNGTGGNLTGYAAGLERKLRLLRLESSSSSSTESEQESGKVSIR